MTERLKLRHKVTGEEKGPYWGLWNANIWVTLFATGEYDYIRSSDCYGVADINDTRINGIK